MIDHTIKTRLLLRPVRSSLGTILLSGVNQGGMGVGMGDRPLRTLNYYAFNYVMSGAGGYRDGRVRSLKVEKGDLVMFFPGVAHGCGTAPGEFWDELWFEFEGPIFDLMLETGVLDSKRPVNRTRDCDYWFRRFFQVIPPVHLRQSTAPQTIVAGFASVLTEILSGGNTAAEAPVPQDDWIEIACQLLADTESSGVAHVAKVARKVGLSYETFRKRFRASVGCSPGHFQLDARIDRAAALLHQGRLSVKEIAAQLNFCDEFYFSHCFKRRFGQSPSAFRRRVRGD